MGKTNRITAISGVILFLFLSGNISGKTYRTDRSVSDQVQTTTKSTQTGSKTVQAKTKSSQTGTKTVQTKKKVTTTGTKSVQTKPKPKATGVKTSTSKSKPAASPKAVSEKKAIDPESVSIGTQRWAIANLNVSTFRNGDSIPQVKSNKDWVAAGDAGKPAWCYYNNNPAFGAKYGKLYNWYAVNDPRGLAPEGWVLASDEDWAKLANNTGGQNAGENLKSGTGWTEGNNGSNKSGFIGLPGGYRIENGLFQNVGSIGIWWSTTETRSLSASDHYLSGTGTLGMSSSPKQRGESVRCLRYP